MTNDGEKFRPSDWSKRLACVAAEFKDNRISYHPCVVPCFVDEHDVTGVCINYDLAFGEQDLYQHFMNFARTNNLIIIPGRRTNNRKEKDV